MPAPNPIPRGSASRLALAVSASLCGLFSVLLATPASLRAQGVVLDQGQFAVVVNGRRVGTEEFAIRRAGLGRDDAIFANAQVERTADGGRQTIRTLLRATAPGGVAEGYQVRVEGVGALELQATLAGRRYVAVVRSAEGEEDREFAAHADTRVLDLDVAHQHFFLRDLAAGSTFHALVPRDRRQVTVSVDASEETETSLGRAPVPARRVVFTASDGERRIVWYDRLGRVLRVEIPSAGYLAERIDLIG